MNSKHSNMRRAARAVFAVLLLAVGSMGSLFGQSGDRRLFQEAESRFRSRDYELALQRYNTLLEEYPLSSYVPDVQFRRAVSVFRLGRQEEALELFRRIETRYPTTRFIEFVPFWIGVIHYNRQEFESAAAYLERYLQGGDRSLTGQARLYLAVSRDKLGDAAAAIHHLEAALRENTDGPNPEDALPLLASLYVRTGEYRKMLDLAEQTDLAGLPAAQRERILLYRAEAFWHVDDRAAASDLYYELLEAPPDIASIAFQRLFIYHQDSGDEEPLQNIVHTAEIRLAGFPRILAEFWLRIGIESYTEGKTELARSYFQRIWNMRDFASMSGLVPLYLADIQFRSGDRSQAFRTVSSFLERSDDRRELLVYRLAGFHLEAEQWEDAASTYSTFLSSFEDSKYYSEASYLHAYALYKQQHFAEAVGRVETTLQSARGEAYTARLLRLKSVLHKQAGDLEAAVQTLREYVPLEPNDARASTDLIKLLFRLRDFEGTIREIERFADTEPFNDPSTTYFVLSRYMYGLSLITKKQYADAAAALEEIRSERLRRSGLEVISPYVHFYRGWAYYRTGDYRAAELDFARLVESAPDHELQPRAAYLAGWSSFVLGEYSQAERYLTAMGETADASLSRKARFLLAKNLEGLGRIGEAAIVFESIYLAEPDSAIADDALFEYAGVLAALDKVAESVDAYMKLFEEFPTSPLAEESMYKRAELLFDRGEFEAARQAFYEYRTEFPRGELVDAALYWGGLASYQTNEPFGAVLLWEKLIDTYRGSAFRADALRRTAEVYEGSGDFRKALNYFGELISSYPEEARAVAAESRAQKLRYLLLGLDETEAELSVVIGREGSDSREGRQALLELARVYIYKSGTKQNLAPALLNEVLAKRHEDRQTAAQAQYLYGEYFYRKNDLQRAANEFLEVIAVNPDDRDLAGQSLYRAAEMTKLAGDMRTARALVERIGQNFPSSQWMEAGLRLIEDE